MPEKLLIVDGEPEMLSLLSMLVREMTPYEPMATNNPIEALEIVRQGGIALVITGLKMPVMDGFELLEAVKRADEYTPVIIVTSYGSTDTAVEALRRGAFDFIVKPFRKERMLFAIDRALEFARLRRDNTALAIRQS